MREKLMMLVVLVALSIASALMLAGLDYALKDIIEKNRDIKLKMATLSALGIPYGDDNAAAVFDERVKNIPTPAGTVYLSAQQMPPGKLIDGAAFVVKGAGFWGAISVMVGVDASDFSIKGIEILEQTETPGLGARIEESRFRDQFRGKFITAPITVRIRGERPADNDIEAITGATMTSRYFETIINEGSHPYIEAIKGLRND